MTATATVHEALSGLFDARDAAVFVVSGYDETILYANDGLGRLGHQLNATPYLPVNFLGRNMRDVASVLGVPYPDSTVAQVLTAGQFHCTELQPAVWLCGSILPLSDISSTAIFSVHHSQDCHNAQQQHVALLGQATIALEVSECERLIQVGMEALHRARQRIHSLRDALLTVEIRGFASTD